MAQVQLENVFAAFPVEITKAQRSAFTAGVRKMSFGRVYARDRSHYIVALKDINLRLSRGHRIGLMGRNGSGKSTLLRLLGGIIPPSYGVRQVSGTVGCVLGMGAGLDVDKTGYQNMRLVTRLLGLRAKDLDAVLDEAIEFCELGPYIEMPVRTYSAGMIGRLNFAIATARRADIMLIDEIIGTGDQRFVEKAGARARDMCAQSGISVVASHSDKILTSFADIGIWMDAGEIKAIGPIREVIAQYTAFLISLGEI